MRRLVAILLSLGLLGLASAASASAAACPRLTGYAVLQVDTATNTGEGMAYVIYDGAYEEVPFDSAAILPTPPFEVLQNWEFSAGTVLFHEYANPMPFGDSYLTINSPVEVDDGGSGSLRYRGLYDLTTDTATFLVSGRLCID